ncbi:cupin domain-containing protein [Carboxydothermus ferrireducens]|uniref:Ethanolamine utilization protein EutQ n=1 Tax=Carboxydothermus ferrireducens DSM 11255 TaxID=1119529 RepID=A0ABX2RF55_9THEO|nr:cupin domain-containing protein [Carboxydothermus ferrireducens]NYE58480.1 ethanolamine utilization protein EutQ [Carboxydothermus ferrireducens DSM 11255]
MGRKAITATDIKSLLQKGCDTLYLEKDVILTPAAKDLIKEFNLKVENSDSPMNLEKPWEKPVQNPLSLEQEVIKRIVKDVLKNLFPQFLNERGLEKEADQSGLILVKGRSVTFEQFNTGNPKDNVTIRELFTLKESPNISAGFMEIKNSRFDWELSYEEVDYVLEGTLEIIVNGKTYQGKAGDVFYLPKNTKITFSSPDYAKFFYVTYPANWAELSNYQK